MKLHWIVDVDINGETQPNLARDIRSLGHKVTPLSNAREFPRFLQPNDLDEPFVYVFHGSFKELNKVKKQVSIATYGLGPSILRSHYTSYVPRGWFFNYESRMTTWGYFCKYPEDFWNVADQKHFIRPDSGNKTFTGQVISQYRSYRSDSFKEEIEKLEQTSNVKPETIIWVSEANPIHNEYRFWISNKKVVASTEYSWDKNHVCGAVPKNALNKAIDVANHPWQLDRIYVVDIAVFDGSVSVLEFNSFSCSGLYHCDSKALFEAVSNDILAEWAED